SSEKGTRKFHFWRQLTCGGITANLVIAAACLHEEKWRFSYGRKLTPARIAEFVLPNDRELEEWVAEQITQTKRVVKAALEGYDPAIRDAFYI
ncbi:hypothetical protein, partial [Xanthomonas phaseoli]